MQNKPTTTDPGPVHRAEQIVDELNKMARDGFDLDWMHEHARGLPEVKTLRGFLSPRAPEIELHDGAVIEWDRRGGVWEFAHPADDAAALTRLLAIRHAGAPAWARILVEPTTLRMMVRFQAPADVAAWVTALGSAATVGVEDFPESGIRFHRCDVVDWLPGWTIYLACREDLKPSQIDAEVP